MKFWPSQLRRELRLVEAELKAVRNLLYAAHGNIRYWRTRTERAEGLCEPVERKTAGYDEWTGKWFNADDPDEGEAVREAALRVQKLRALREDRQ